MPQPLGQSDWSEPAIQPLRLTAGPLRRFRLDPSMNALTANNVEKTKAAVLRWRHVHMRAANRAESDNSRGVGRLRPGDRLHLRRRRPCRTGKNAQSVQRQYYQAR